MMKVLKYSLIGLFSTLGILTVQGQQEAQYTQYMFNGLAINPAYAGSRDVLSVVGLYRKQWVGIDGAPQTMSLSGHAPLTEQLSIGAQVVNDQIGINQKTNLIGTFSYWIPLNDRGTRLSFGIQGGVDNYKVDNNKLNLSSPDEDNFSENFSAFKPNIGAGLYLYSERLMLGLSTLELVKNEFGTAQSNFEQFRHLFTYAGYVFDLNQDWKFKPTLLFKGVAGAPLEMDVTAHFLYKEKLWLGGTWRSFASVDVLAHYFINDQLSIGYAYDLSTTKLIQHNKGSHEIMFRFEPKFGTNKKVISPRYF